MRLAALAHERGLRYCPAADADGQARLLANRVAEALNLRLSSAGMASLALSGGRSPQAFLRALDQLPIDWSRIRLTLVDERWVPESHADSNAAMIKRCMPNALQRAHWYGLYQGARQSNSAEAYAAQGLEQAPESATEAGAGRDAAAASDYLLGWLPLDVVVLGMGVDGHCASLFPGQPGLEQRLRATSTPLCEAVPGPQQSLRLTLTGCALRTARLQLLAISGEDKYRRLCDAFNGPAVRWPVAAFLAPPLEIFYSP
ncbi:6-phosphogluconolactonase [Halopseudomonas pelagia]|uniref:6-phosphogluconolactonase n=1 Tax=Halopseudomonas pelagia TaxID=553151 RepID=UPI0030DAB296|tara:strand:+ start:13571 stop:14344 length:774 start_codon:yes stop_codon:yes gene_type:complete